MQGDQVREIRPAPRPFGGYRDELLATMMTLTLVVMVSFMAVSRMMGQTDTPADSETPSAETEQLLGAVDEPTPAPVIAALPLEEEESEATEGAIVYSVVPFGEDAVFEYDAYSMELTSPRIVFDAATNTKRRLLVDVVLKNRAVEAGLPVKMTVSIVKDGAVIVSAAAMYLPQSRTLAVGEMYQGIASLALIEATDARELKFEPGNELPAVSHFLY
jgi:hypothetical protein